MGQMQLRYAGMCGTCAEALSAGTSAWWDPGTRIVTCLPCWVVASPGSQGGAGDGIERGVAGAAARREAARRVARREADVRARHPRLGGLLLAVTDDPQSTQAWSQGAVGEVKVGRALDAAADRGIAVLHDRRMPRSRANIDHLVVAPTGIWVVDAKRYTGRLEQRDVGGWFRRDHRLYVGGRDRTKLVDGVARQLAAVEAALAGASFEGAPVSGALCFVDTELGLFAKPFRLRGVLVTWPRQLIPAMAATTQLDASVRAELLGHLAARFPPA